MKKSLFLFVILSFIVFSVPANAAENTNYESIYNNLPVLDFYYDHNEDPDEQLDYHDFIKSPYPLIRISAKLSCKEVKLLPGYYLMAVRNRSNYDFVMFKQNGKIVTMVPVYEKQLVNPETVYPKPKVKKSLLKKTGSGIKRIVAAPFKPYRKPPEPPRYAVTSSLVDGGKYFEIWLYQEQYLYKILFKVDKKG
jgi:hypothetical protein